ncbi:MAG TPA: hypothetical protein VH518_01365, partial [Tepidisphaeraceae bacterium]
ALQSLRPEQAVIAIVPDECDLAVILHCNDFSDEISSHRLWFASGPDWEAALHGLLESEPGLATPTNFIRLPHSDTDSIDRMISTAQRVFARISAARSSQIQSIRQSPRGDGESRICVVAPSRFRLWSDIGDQMLGVFQGSEQIKALHFDADDPACSSPLALAMAAGECAAMFTANTGRSDLPGIAPEMMPWITWVTGGRIPSSALAGIDDHLIVVDPTLRDAAVAGGWHEKRVHLGGWSGSGAHGKAVGIQEEKHLSVLLDTVSVETPKELIEYSSHSVLWEAVRQELGQNPFVLEDVNAYLNVRMRQLGVGEESFPRMRFIEKLVLPAYQQGLVRSLIAARLPVKLYGRGWDALDEFGSFACGPIRSRQEFDDAISASSVLIHAWPTKLAHPIDACDMPVVRAAGCRNILEFVKQATLNLGAKIPAPQKSDVPPLSIETILMILRACSVR